MDIEEYKQQRENYEQFAEVVRNILASAISNASQNGSHKYRLQHIQSRAKELGSLEKKIEKSEYGEEDKQNIEGFVGDLAGCRVVFYHNDDVSEFLKSGIIRDNFEVDWDKSKFHYIKDEIKDANDYYTANHYIVELKEDRTALPEYSAFQGMRCEIQVHTVLNHAWSETAHDITYKSPSDDESDFGRKIRENINKRLGKIMQDYLFPAGVEFQKVLHDHQMLLDGQLVYDKNIKKELKESKDNNERFALLESFTDSVLPLCEQEFLEKRIEEIFDIVRTGVKTAKGVPTVDIDTYFGPIEGKTFRDVFEAALKIVDFVRYFDVEATYDILFELLAMAEEKGESDKDIEDLIVKSAKKLASYHLEILKQAGVYVQKTLISKLTKLTEQELLNSRQLVLAICSEAVESSAESTTSTFDTMTLSRGALIGDDHLSDLRLQAISILKKLYSNADTESEKKQVIAALDRATRTPSPGGYKDELLAVIFRDSVEVVNFYESIIETEKYEILESLEERILFLYRRAMGLLETKRCNKDCLDLCEKMVVAAENFRDKLNAIEEFVIYKHLVGFQSVFPCAWESDSKDFQGEKKYRKEKIEEFVHGINDKNAEFWQKIIVRCTKTTSDDMATFPCLITFLQLVSEQKPNFILDVLNQYESDIARFLTAILEGLLKSPSKDVAVKMMYAWVNKGEHLYSCANVFQFYKEIDLELLEKILDKAIEAEDVATIVIMITVANVNFETNPELLQKIFIPAISALTNLGKVYWVNNIWWRKERVPLLEALSDDEIDLVLKNMMNLERVEHHDEEILKPIAKKCPEKVLRFFFDRLKAKKDFELDSSYDAIPYDFYCLAECLSAIPHKVIELALESFDEKEYSFFMHRQARLVKNIFPEFSQEFENKLIELVRSSVEKNLLFVLTILRNYEGKSFIHNVCKEIIKSLPENSNYITEIMIILESAGVISGQFGRVELYKARKEEVRGWLNDPNEKIRAFAERYTSSLDKMIASERKSATEEIEMRKHIYGTNDAKKEEKDSNKKGEDEDSD